MGSSCVSFCFVLIVLIVSVFGTSEREKERKKERSAVLSSSSDLVDLFTVYSHTHRRVALHEEKRGGVILPFVSDTLVLGPCVSLKVMLSTNVRS